MGNLLVTLLSDLSVFSHFFCNLLAFSACVTMGTPLMFCLFLLFLALSGQRPFLTKKMSISMLSRKDFKQKMIIVIFLEVGNQIQMEPTSNLAKQSQKLEMHEKGGVHGT